RKGGKDTPSLQTDDQPEPAGRVSDLVDRAVFDPNAGKIVDQHHLALERRKPRRLLPQHVIEVRPNPKTFDVASFERQLGNGALDDLDADMAIANVLRRHDRPAQVIAGLAIEITDTDRDVGERCKRHALAQIRPIHARDRVSGYRVHIADRHLTQFKLQAADSPWTFTASKLRQFYRRSRTRGWRLLRFELSLDLARIVHRRSLLCCRRYRKHQGHDDERK